MDYEPYDSSGTDDDLPPSHQHRMSRGGRISGNGRPAAMGTQIPYARMYDDTDMEAQLHQLEKEAYSSVLKAFKAQADAISWEKESLMTELRKELKLSNEEHRDLLSRVTADETIRRLRFCMCEGIITKTNLERFPLAPLIADEKCKRNVTSRWRQSFGPQPGFHGVAQASHDSLPSPSVSASRKKQKMAPSLPTQSFTGPSPFHPQTMGATNQPSSLAANRGPMMGVKSKKSKPIPPVPSSLIKQYPPGPAGRGQFGNNRISSGGHANGPAEGSSFDPLIGRKVRTRWPDDNTFYEAVISDYNPVEGRHALVYDIGTQSETWEWVNLSEISPDDIKWDGEDPGVSRHGHEGYVGPGHGAGRPRDNNVPGSGRGRGLTKSQPRKDFPLSQNGIGKKGPDDIRLLHTDTLIKEVERVFCASHQDPTEIEKSKKVLKGSTNKHLQMQLRGCQIYAMVDSDDEGGDCFFYGQVSNIEERAADLSS
ncbi:hypothetical protein CASFOL_031258 [Castilleja foliolosa]|uniref:ENT domain-containing protein n=1 Tax=Castilleja foliolosa TaxID=1961234 RepID=A0ABD3C465_9LAMI